MGSRVDMEIGARVRVARTARGVTQTVLAEALGITQASVVAMERGERQWSAERTAKAAAFLGVKVAHLYPAPYAEDDDPVADEPVPVPATG